MPSSGTEVEVMSSSAGRWPRVVQVEAQSCGWLAKAVRVGLDGVAEVWEP